MHGLDELYSKMRMCCDNGEGTIVSPVRLIGTSDDSNLQARDVLINMRDNPEAYNLHVYFVGKQHIQHVQPDGFTDEKRVIAEETAERQKIMKLGSLQKLITHKSINPLTITDCFSVSGNTTLDLEELGARLTHLETNVNNVNSDDPILLRRGWFQFKDDIFTTKFVDDPLGGWTIYELPSEELHRPMKGDLPAGPVPVYFAGADPTTELALDSKQVARVNNGQTNQHSRQSMVVHNVFTHTPVAYYLYRHGNARMDYLQMLQACIHYNCYMCPETNVNALELYFKTFGYKGSPRFFEKWLYPTPDDLGGNLNRRRVGGAALRYGLKTESNKISLYTSVMPEFWAQYVDNVMFPEMCKTFINWNIYDKKRTPDLGMAFLMTLVGAESLERRYEKKKFLPNTDNVLTSINTLTRRSAPFGVFSQW
jgi:hypothetical protein